MAANIWKNSLKNVESDNNKILYETLFDFFYSETVLTFRIRLAVKIWVKKFSLPLFLLNNNNEQQKLCVLIRGPSKQFR